MIPEPPRRALSFLRWFCREDCIEEIEGDLVELFEMMWLDNPARAKRQFIWRVLLSFHPEFLRSPAKLRNSNLKSMIQHNILMSYRSFKRYKSSFLINLFGLSTGLACVLLIWLWVSDELSIDKFHANDAQLYEVMEHVTQANGMITRYTTPGPMSVALVEEFPEIEKAVTTTSLWEQRFVLTVNNNDITATGMYADPDFFTMFSYDILQGSAAEVLKDKQAIVLSERLAMSLFGTTENLIGKAVQWEHERDFLISGIMKQPPTHSSLNFDFVMSFELFRAENEWVRNWFNTAATTYVQIKEGTDVAALNEKLFDLVRVKTENQADHRSPFVTKFSDLYLYNRYENGVQAGGRIDYVTLFSVIAIFILLIACINFMNLSTAQASRRLKEVGVKKAMGANRSTLIFQYLSESICIVLISMVVSLLIVILFLPKFNQITGKELQLVFDIQLFLSVVAIMLFTGIVAGSYPAFYLSAFNPVKVLKGKLSNLKGEQWARKGLVVFQFALSITLIVAVWVVYQQIDYAQTKNLGYDQENVIRVRKNGDLERAERAETFIQEVKKLPGVLEASALSHNLTGHNGGTYGVEWPGKDPNDRTEFERVAADYGAIELLNIKMKEGRPFDRSFGADSSKIIFNEAAIEFMGIEDPIGKKVVLWGNEREIIGVMEDFHFDSFREEVKPLFIALNPEWAFNILVRVEEGRTKEAIAGLDQLHAELNAGYQLDFHFMDESFDILYASEQRVSLLSRYFAGLAVIISCLGLFGLAAFTAERRIKEIGIRKILGSSEWSIIYLLGKDFTSMVLIAILIALPPSYLLSREWLNSFEYRIELEWWLFAGSAAVALLIAWITVSLQTMKVSRVNPVICIKDE